jgi:hypothetical protein
VPRTIKDKIHSAALRGPEARTANGRRAP